MTRDELIVLAFEYLELNPDRFDSQEKVKFMQDLQNWMIGKSDTIDDEVYDFLVTAKVYDKPRREEQYVSYLNKKFGNIAFTRVLDVGAGRMCRLSTELVKKGVRAFAMDPKIRLSEDEAYDLGIAGISKDRFVCDKFSEPGRKGTDIRRFNYIVGLEPCDATEHIIRQSLKYEKPFDVLLCAAPHDALTGKKFETYEDWYEYLYRISDDVDIIKDESGSYHATSDAKKITEREL